MSAYSWFNTANGGALTPSATTNGGGYYQFSYSSWGEGMQLTMPFGITESGYAIGGYYFWWDGTDSVLLYDMCLWQFTDNTWSAVSDSDIASPSSLTEGWNYLQLGSPINLQTGILYAVVTNQTDGFYDNTGFFADYGSGIVNGPLTLYGPGTITDSQVAGVFGEVTVDSAADLSAFPDTSYINSGYPIDVVIQAAALSVMTSSLQGATVGTAYSQTLTATGGTGPYSWTVVSGSVPNSLSLSGSGTISGTPTSTGTSSFTVQVEDADSNTATANLSITVSSAPTTYTLWAPNTNGGAFDDDPGGNALSVGNQFSVSQNVPLTGIWWWSPSGSSVLPSACAIYNLDTGGQVAGTLNSSPTWSGVLGAGWVKCAYGGSISLSADTNYMVVVFGDSGGSGWFGGSGGYWTTGGDGADGLTNGVLSAPSSAGSLYGQSAYIYGSSISLPTSTVAGYNFWVDVEVSSGDEGDLLISTTSFANIPTNVSILRFISATGGTMPYVWSVSSGFLPTGLSLTTNGDLAGTLSGVATEAGSYGFTLEATDADSNTASSAFSITVVDAPFTPTNASTDGNGVITWQITSSINLDDSESIRVLRPTAPTNGYLHGLLFTLPVAGGADDTSYGNGLDTIRELDLHNAYNLTIIEPSTGGNWLADNPSNSGLIQESYILQVAAWAQATYGIGGEKLYLIGFSRSGIGGQGLFFHHPDIFYGVVSWDFPAMMTTYDGTDVDGTTGGDPAGSYGTQDNFADNYELSSTNLARWANAQNFVTDNRIWIGGYYAFYDDVNDYDPVLTTAGILHTYAKVEASEHNWAPSPGWVAPALAALLGPPRSEPANGALIALFL